MALFVEVPLPAGPQEQHDRSAGCSSEGRGFPPSTSPPSLARGRRRWPFGGVADHARSRAICHARCTLEVVRVSNRYLGSVDRARCVVAAKCRGLIRGIRVAAALAANLARDGQRPVAAVVGLRVPACPIAAAHCVLFLATAAAMARRADALTGRPLTDSYS